MSVAKTKSESKSMRSVQGEVVDVFSREKQRE